MSADDEVRASTVVDPFHGHWPRERIRYTDPPEAARRLGIPTKELLGLIYDRKIRYVVVKGIAHVPDDAVEEFRDRAS